MFQNTVHGECIYGNLLNGEWVESESGKQLEIRSPVDGSLIGKFHCLFYWDFQWYIESIFFQVQNMDKEAIPFSGGYSPAMWGNIATSAVVNGFAVFR